MYLKSLNLNNFRKFQNLQVEFTKGLNLLVGENDAGKTAIVDAIKYVLNTQSFDYIRPSYEDFLTLKVMNCIEKMIFILNVFLKI